MDKIGVSCTVRVFVKGRLCKDLPRQFDTLSQVYDVLGVAQVVGVQQWILLRVGALEPHRAPA